MESSKATVILKITRASPKYTKDQTVQAKIEDGVFEDIQNLHRKNKRVTSLIIFWKVSEIYPMFRGGVTSRDYIGNIWNWFY